VSPTDPPARPYRDLAAFDARAGGYDAGRLGRMHHEIAQATARLAAVGGAARRVLDLGCGTGYLLRRLAGAWPEAERLVGVDPAPQMLATAATTGGDGRLRFVLGLAEHLPFPDGAFDLVVSTTSFDHWSDQAAGLAECARVLAPGGRLVLVDQFSAWLAPTVLASRRGKARTKRRANRLALAAGFRAPAWHPVYAVIINGLTATR
jgi:ubiquinone/menaquinone biosynthesis C-methylase UbiE